jgi:hypothetical protein
LLGQVAPKLPRWCRPPEIRQRLRRSAVVTVSGAAYNVAAPVTRRKEVIMGPLGPLQNFVFVVAALAGGVFLALIIYGYRKEKDVDSPT